MLQVRVASNLERDINKVRMCMHSYVTYELRLLHMFDLQQISGFEKAIHSDGAAAMRRSTNEVALHLK